MIKGTEFVEKYVGGQREYLNILEQMERHPWIQIYGIGASQRSLWTGLLAMKKKRHILYVAEKTEMIKGLMEELAFWLPDHNVQYFPPLDMLPFEVLAQSKETRWKRLEVIQNLLFSQEPSLVVTTIEALRKMMQKPSSLKEGFLRLEVGAVQEVRALMRWLAVRGYEVVERVEEKGQMALRGGILDVYSPTAETPYRIEFFDDEIDSLRTFSPETQRTLEKVQALWLAPACEVIFQETARKGIQKALEKENKGLGKAHPQLNFWKDQLQEEAFFPGYEQLLAYAQEEQALLTDFFEGPFQCIMVEPSRQVESSALWEMEYRETCLSLLEQDKICPGQMKNYISLDELVPILGEKGIVYYSMLPKRPPWFERTSMVSLTTKSVPLFLHKSQLLLDELVEWKRQGYGVLMVVSSQERALRLQSSLRDLGHEAHYNPEGESLRSGGLYIIEGKISAGFEWSAMKLALVSEHELYFQPKKKTAKRLFKEGRKQVLLDDLRPGDYVVHVSYGIGRYEGIENIKVDEAQRDYLLIQYHGADRLYVPTDQASLLQKYMGSEGSKPRLSKLGGSEWQKTKAKAQKVIADMADDLLALYAARSTLPGFAFAPDTPWQREFEDAFPFEETPDQHQSIEAVKKDMEQARPMDRLLCGDVGYGKTEVAMRAAFKAVTSGKQVAVLVPTTVLSQQHFKTFQERFEGFAMNIGVLNRFRSSREIREALAQIDQGRIDVVIGTHRLLSKDVRFKDLGLLVVDEEQRFGVVHKERIKQLKEAVDVLTLSATPIPRTLHMALTGIRDLSVIETPPEERYPVQTYVVEHSVPLIKEAIRREMARGGQVYYLRNRIEDIERVRDELGQLVPEARIACAHGKMSELTLERVMVDFMEGNIDVLVCTTIIESGLDIANANTVIIDQADRLGLSQLYQIRGRVGRSNRIAYAYLTYRRDKTLTEIAEKRLAAIREFTELGAGYKIAMKDLEIRGAGDLLGSQQHGQIAAVGFELYCKMLEEEIQKRKAAGSEASADSKTVTAEDVVSIDLQIKAFIPADYMPDASAKIDFYQRINYARSKEDIEDLHEEMVDRFGDAPAPLINLLHIGVLKTMARQAKVTEILQEKAQVKLKMAQDHGLTGPVLMDLVRQNRRKISFNASQGLEIVVALSQMEPKGLLPYLVELMGTLVDLVMKRDSLV